MARYRIITASTFEPVLLADIRNWLGLYTDTSHDTVIGLLISSARQRIERELGIIICETEIEESWLTNDITDAKLSTAFMPSSAILSATAIKDDDTTVDISSYCTLDIFTGEVRIKYMSHGLKEIRLTYNTGYPDIDSIPAVLKEAMMLMIRSAFDERADQITDSNWKQAAHRVASTFRQYYRSAEVCSQ